MRSCTVHFGLYQIFLGKKWFDDLCFWFISITGLNFEGWKPFFQIALLHAAVVPSLPQNFYSLPVTEIVHYYVFLNVFVKSRKHLPTIKKISLYKTNLKKFVFISSDEDS